MKKTYHTNQQYIIFAWPVGSTLGTEEGAVGLSVGFVGKAEGSPLGPKEGVEEGSKVGTSVGTCVAITFVGR